MNLFRYCIILLSITTIMLIQACGGSGSGGDGASSSSASLELAASSTVAAGNIVSATVKLTSSTAAPVNGVSVSVDVLSMGSVIASYSSNTNSAGIAVIYVPTSMVNSNGVVSLIARSNGITPSTTVNVVVTAPTLASNIPVTSTVTAAAGTVTTLVLSADAISFKDGNGNGIPGQVVNFKYDSVSGDTVTSVLRTNATVIPVGGGFNVTTGADGNANTGITLTLTAPAVVGSASTATFYYTLSTTYLGVTFSRQFSAQYELTAS